VKEFMNKVALHYPTKVILHERFLSEKLSNLSGWSPNNKKLVHVRAFCHWPFTSMFITTNGNVSLCCNDFLFEEVMGNVHRQQLMDIWHGEKYNYVRRQLSIGNRSFSHLCKVCDGRSGGFPYKWLDNPFDYFIIKYVIGDI
jgi:radical SAM protein with 4Fe4S-binding SPASM domain